VTASSSKTFKSWSCSYSRTTTGYYCGNTSFPFEARQLKANTDRDSRVSYTIHASQAFSSIDGASIMQDVVLGAAS